MNIAFLMIRKTESAYKEKKLYIYIYSQEKKAGKNSYKRTQKRATQKVALNNPAKVSTTKVPTTFL